MDIQTILFSFKGRIGRGTYWLSIVPVIVAVHFITFAPILIVGFIVGTESEEIPDSILIAGFAAQMIWLAGGLCWRSLCSCCGQRRCGMKERWHRAPVWRPPRDSSVPKV